MDPVTPAIRAKAADNIRKAKVQLVLHQPFFASIVLKRVIDVRDDVPTAYMTANGKIVVGTAFVAKQTVQKTVGLLCHESMHYAMLHHQRVGWRKARPANVAMDKVINDILQQSGLELPDGGTLQAGAKDYAWEQLYNEDDNGGGGDGPYNPGNGQDDLSTEGIDTIGAEEIQQIKQELIQAATAAKSRGTMPAGLERLISDIVNPRTPWHQLLERYMTNFKKEHVTWSRPRKNMLPLYLPSMSKNPAMGCIVIQMDESGSVGMDERRHFFGHVNKIIESCNPEKVYLLHTDSEVHLAEEFTMDDMPIEYKNVACGGTDMTAGFRWCDENGVEPDVFVCLTDGETPWISSHVGYPVVVLCTTDAVLDHCELIPYEVTED